MRWGYAVAATSAVVIAVLAPGTRNPSFVWNASASAPLGLYFVSRNNDLKRGELVVAGLPNGADQLAARRAYLPPRVPVIKHIAAVSGDTVCGLANSVVIDGHTVARPLRADKEGRTLPAWHGCVRLDADQVFLLTAAVPDSFDGRYFGPVSRKAIVGKAVPLWTW